MFRNLLRVFVLLFVLTLIMKASPFDSVLAQEHVVSSTELHETLLESARTRLADVETVQNFFSSDLAKKNLNQHLVKLSKVEQAIPFLSDEELSQLASQCRQVEADVSAGTLTNEQITYIIIALATAVIILVIIAA